MKEEEYYNEIKELIETKEVNSRVRLMQENGDTLTTYWNIGRLIVEAQGGEKRAKYGNELIKKWSEEFTQKYGKGYSNRNMKYMRQFFLKFQKGQPLVAQLSWSHYIAILPIKNESERNYYINMCITNHLSKRELIKEIKNKSFERLAYADKENIQLIEPNNYTLTIKDMIKDPIYIEIDNNVNKLDEKTLHQYIIEMLENRFLELGVGFALVGHEYKIKVEGHTFSIDLLFFNIKLNCYVVVELKLRTSSIKDVDQVKYYASLVDKYVKEDSNNNTIGLLISKKEDSFVITYATENDVYATTYKLKEKVKI